MAEEEVQDERGAVAVLENKPCEKVTGASDAERELKTQRIRKAIETSRKEESLYRKYDRKPMKRLGHKKFGEKYYGDFDESGSVVFGGFGGGGKFYGSYGGSGAEPACNYRAAPNRSGYGGYGGGSGYDRRQEGAGGSKGGRDRPGRTCHRCKSTGHLVASCPLPPPEKE